MNETVGEAYQLFAIITVALLLFLWTKGNGAKDEFSQTSILEDTIRQIEGVGDVRVFIYEGKQESGSFFISYFEDEKQALPIEGILIVAEGASNIETTRMLKEAVANVFQISSHRIVIVPMSKKED